MVRVECWPHFAPVCRKWKQRRSVRPQANRLDAPWHCHLDTFFPKYITSPFLCCYNASFCNWILMSAEHDLCCFSVLCLDGFRRPEPTAVSRVSTARRRPFANGDGSETKSVTFRPDGDGHVLLHPVPNTDLWPSFWIKRITCCNNFDKDRVWMSHFEKRSAKCRHFYANQYTFSFQWRRRQKMYLDL